MGRHDDIEIRADPETLRSVTQRVLRDLRALETMIDEGLIEADVRRIGAEQEMAIADASGLPAPVAMEMLEGLDDCRFTTELGRFNLEANLPPLVFSGDCLRRLESQLAEVVARARAEAEKHGADVILTGILPTLRQTDLEMDNMAPIDRYFALNEALKSLRGDAFDLHVKGIDDISVKHESVMLEACNTSFQVHFQVSPQEFARYYNIAQVLAAPVIAVACNSPFLFGKRLWAETRIAVFEQSIDTRLPAQHIQERTPRVSFGSRWVEESVLEIYRDDIARFRVFLALEIDEDPFEAIAAGRPPRLQALALHNGTVYRWNRPCYGIGGGRPHLRIENRVLPSGPTVLDETANAAFWFGLVSAIAAEYEDIRPHIRFDATRANFYRAVRNGLECRLVWLDGKRHPAETLIRDELLPRAEKGLRATGIDDEDIARYLGVIEQRVANGRTGAAWMLRSWENMGNRGLRSQRLRALVKGMRTREDTGMPVHDWPLGDLEEAGTLQHDYRRIGQFMTTDVFTVNQDEVVDLIVSVMAWRKIRHVPVEDDRRHLVGLVSFQGLLQHLSERRGSDGRAVAVREIMITDPITVSPETPTGEAIDILKREGLTCLPVVKDERLVGIVSEHDFLEIAARLLGEIGRKARAEGSTREATEAREPA